MSSAEAPALSAIVGHARWRAFFERAIEADALAHAYLLVGPEGVGKWTFARALARRLACASPAGGDVCGRCGPCVRTAAGRHPDVSLFDARAEGKRGLGVEEVRERLVDALRLKPMEARLRVVAVNDAERMEPAAQNALLKSLEEPPPRSLLILTAPEAAAMLETVVSRCLVLRFAAVADAEVESFLVGRGVPAAQARALAAAAEGRPGRALAWAEDGVADFAGLADAFLRGEVEASAVSANVAALAADLPEQSAFERRRAAALAFCAALAVRVRARLADSPDDLDEATSLERSVEAASELMASATPELALDRLTSGLSVTK